LREHQLCAFVDKSSQSRTGNVVRAIAIALREFENAVRVCARKDALAEATEAWESAKLRACELAAAHVEVKRAALIAMIEELERHAVRGPR
jgi:hypothetical protein